uniref:LIM zinc-binding domain-containing protein n=1 Tax=Erpetoichthys calabaricus TaxID=27687 RepID=A0A8C4RST0_ERPCA
KLSYSNTSLTLTVVCAGCGERVYDRYFLLALDKQWHSGCLRCSLCQSTLDSHLSCFCKDGTIYCKEDYYRQFCVERCAHCGLGIPSSELVMRVRDYVFHLRCFNCQSCGSALQTGDLFTMQVGYVIQHPTVHSVCNRCILKCQLKKKNPHI